jgi:competence CoiA-like predicted nuclease
MRTISEVIDNESENTIQAEAFFAQDEDIIFKQRYELEEAIQLNKKLWVCPICRQMVKIRGRKDGIISMHFAHLADGLDCPIRTGRDYTKDQILRMKYNGQKESPRHNRLKNLIADKISKDERFTEINVEKRFEGICKDWRKPDVSAIFNGKRVVFELQLTTTFLTVIAERNLFYRNNQTYILWIFDNKIQNISSMRFMEKDIFYPNYHNAFFIDANDDGNQFKLICGYERPTIISDTIKNEWELQKINFAELTFSPDFQVYWFDYEDQKKSVQTEIEKIHLDELGNLWKQSRSEEERFHLIEKVSHIIGSQGKDVKDYKLLSLLNCLYSIKFKQVIGYNYDRIIQLLHQDLDKDTVKGPHLGEYIFKAIRVYARDYIKHEDKTGKFYSKAVAYRKRHFELCHKYDPLLKHLFPELFSEETVT